MVLKTAFFFCRILTCDELPLRACRGILQLLSLETRLWRRARCVWHVTTRRLKPRAPDSRAFPPRNIRLKHKPVSDITKRSCFIMTNNSQPPLPVPQVPIREADKQLFASINSFVYEYMSKYDNSHDYQHILRVLSNTNRILQAELKANPSVAYDTTPLFLAALLHDVGDHKYAKPGEDAENQIANTLLQHSASSELATKVQAIVKNLSYSHEVRDPARVASAMAQHPELAIVQDADRLDAIGAVGIARCFSFGAAKMPEQPMDRAISHFEEKLYNLAGMMKTAAGKDMASRRHKVLEEFAKEWKGETELSLELQ